MAFKASSERKRREPRPPGRGKPIRPSAALEEWYRKQMMSVVTPMIADYRETMRKALERPSVERAFATDAAAADEFKSVLNTLRRRWKRIFEGFAQKIAPEFVEKAEQQATSATLNSLRSLGIEQPKSAYNESIRNTLGAAKDFNHTLITGISEEVHNQIYNSVMLSLTSPNPEQQGMTGIQNALKEAGITAKKRVKLIAQDQTSKLYASLSDDRMAENGVEEFEWSHSSAGKTPRKSHLEKDGQIFKLNDPRLWTGPKADQGPPGWAINCRCVKIPIIR